VSKVPKMTASEVAFKLNMINFAEGGNSSKEFFEQVDMPDGRNAWEWIESWSELRKEMGLE
jgi:hypothetical protein